MMVMNKELNRTDQKGFAAVDGGGDGWWWWWWTNSWGPPSYIQTPIHARTRYHPHTPTHTPWSSPVVRAVIVYTSAARPQCTTDCKACEISDFTPHASVDSYKKKTQFARKNLQKKLNLSCPIDPATIRPWLVKYKSKTYMLRDLNKLDFSKQDTLLGECGCASLSREGEEGDERGGEGERKLKFFC